MRRMLCLVLTFVATAVLTPTIASAQEIRVYVDGRPMNFDVPPTAIQGRVLVPLRGVFEQLGATVDFDARTQHIVAMRGSQSVELTLGSRQARVNDAPKLLDVAAFTINGRTMVPLRFVSESLGATVQWVEASRTILIGSPGAVGWNRTVKEALCPAANVTGAVKPVTWKPEPNP